MSFCTRKHLVVRIIIFKCDTATWYFLETEIFREGFKRKKSPKHDTYLWRSEISLMNVYEELLVEKRECLKRILKCGKEKY